jgi:hypothetical protein
MMKDIISYNIISFNSVLSRLGHGDLVHSNVEGFTGLRKQVTV